MVASTLARVAGFLAMMSIAQRGDHHHDRKHRDDQSNAADDDDDESSIHAHSLPENGSPVQVLNLPVDRLAEPGLLSGNYLELISCVLHEDYARLGEPGHRREDQPVRSPFTRRQEPPEPAVTCPRASQDSPRPRSKHAKPRPKARTLRAPLQNLRHRR